LSPSR